MSKLSFKNRETKEISGFTNQYIGYGIHLLKINGAELKTSSTGKYQVKFLVEGKPLDGNFVGADLPDGTKAKGLVGRVNLGIYFSPDDDFKVESLMNNLMYIAEKAEVLDKVSAIEATNIEDLLDKFCKAVANKYMWFVIKGDEYSKDGKSGFALSFKEGKVGQNGDQKLFQVYCKHEKFFNGDAKDITRDGDRIIKLFGVNVVGSAIGRRDSINFDPKYDLKTLAAVTQEADKEEDELSDIDTIFPKADTKSPF